MAEKKVVTEVETDSPDLVEKAKGFWAEFSRPIIYVGSAVILLLSGWYIYHNFVKVPKEQKAEEVIFPAEKMFDYMASNGGFNKDSMEIVLNGDRMGTTGVLKIISNYGGTKAGNRAEYMAGACYLNEKQFDKAIKYLKEFDGYGADQVQSKADLMIGHAYAEQKKQDDALSYYKKAASVLSDKDESQKAYALFVAGRYADYIGKNKEAIDIFTDLKDNFPTTSQVTSGEVDKYLSKLGVTR